MITEYRNSPLSDYVIHKIYYAESAEEYTYYLYIHPSSPAIIMRVDSEATEFLYADAGIGTAEWDNRTELTYTTFDKLAKG